MNAPSSVAIVTGAGVALVTGAGQGLGRATAQRLHADGHEIVAVDLDGVKARATAEAVGGEWRVCDVGDRSAVAALAASLPDGIDILINNAGIWRFGPLTTADPVDIDSVLRTNLAGTLHCALAFAPLMAARGGGSIVNLTSAAAPMRAQGVGIYPVSKAAVEALTQQLAVELGPQHIRVNAVGPGMIVTEGTAPSYADPAVLAARTAMVPLREIGIPTDIADAIAFLVSPAARYISGQILYVDGGVTAGRS